MNKRKLHLFFNPLPLYMICGAVVLVIVNTIPFQLFSVLLLVTLTWLLLSLQIILVKDKMLFVKRHLISNPIKLIFDKVVVHGKQILFIYEAGIDVSSIFLRESFDFDELHIQDVLSEKDFRIKMNARKIYDALEREYSKSH